jgi:predicted transcriptional regulator of viral defense system
MDPGGLSAENRQLVEQLHRRFSQPFTAKDAAEALDIDPSRAGRLVRYLADRGWLDRVCRGLYLPVPLDAHRSGVAHKDPWVLASAAFRPAYIAGWSAAEHWNLTEQVFRDVLVVTGSRPRDRHPTVGGTRFVLHTLDAAKRFGLVPVWRGGDRVDVTDPSRTVVDVLAAPGWGGGIRHVGQVLSEYLLSTHRRDDLLLGYGDRLGNRAVFKRLGFLIEQIGFDAPGLVHACLNRRSSGVIALDPSVRTEGHIVSRWGVRANVDLAAGAS